MTRCPLTGRIVNPIQLADQLAFCYETPETGIICFTDVAFPEADNLSQSEKQILAGISRNRAIKKEKPETYSSAFLRTLMQQDIPYAFEARARHFLRYLYDNGGKEYKSFDIDAKRDSAIAYTSREELERIVKYLKSESWIEIGQDFAGSGNYRNLTLTRFGIEEVEKGQPKMPMYGLVNQQISTGDVSIDATIEQARKAFFNQPTSFESKRSACETLSYILEPLRNELKDKFDSDTEAFFNIVNSFNIRHNKLSTKRINDEEQLEWVFYSLLNTINTFVKMKRKKI